MNEEINRLINSLEFIKGNIMSNNKHITTRDIQRRITSIINRLKKVNEK